MQKYDIHVCLISSQAAPNLLPILDRNFKPKQAIFITTNKMKEKAGYLKKVFEKKNIKVSIEDLKDEFNFSEMENEIFTILGEYVEENIALNVTGGTKLMAIAAQNAFSAAGKPIFYVDTDKNNKIIFVSKQENNQRIEDKALETNIKLEDYFNAYGFSLLKKETDKLDSIWFNIVNKFISNYVRYSNIVPILNGYASKAKKQGLSIEIDKSHKKINAFTDILTELEKFNLIEYSTDNIKFKNEKARFFLNGGWLEEYAYHQLREAKNINDILNNIEVANSFYNENKNEYNKNNKGNKNEFDIAFMAKNKLHIIECKTQKMDKSNSGKAEDILYKLETLKDYGGLLTKKCLISYCEITEAVKNRAKSLNIEIIQGSELKQMKAKIQNWIGKN